MSRLIDDSGLFHGEYDPVYAREYYLRTRKLKGRKTGSSSSTPRSPKRDPKSAQGSTMTHRPAAGNTDQARRREELKRQKEALQARLERLQEVLRELVDAAQKRNKKNSNAKPSEKSSSKKSSPTKAESKTSAKDRKKETPAQKRERAKKAKEAYEKENPGSLSDDVEILREQVRDIQEKIRKAVRDAQDRKRKAGQSKNSKLRSETDSTLTDGPRGR